MFARILNTTQLTLISCSNSTLAFSNQCSISISPENVRKSGFRNVFGEYRNWTSVWTDTGLSQNFLSEAEIDWFAELFRENVVNYLVYLVISKRIYNSLNFAKSKNLRLSLRNIYSKYLSGMCYYSKTRKPFFMRKKQTRSKTEPTKRNRYKKEKTNAAR